MKRDAMPASTSLVARFEPLIRQFFKFGVVGLAGLVVDTATVTFGFEGFDFSSRVSGPWAKGAAS